MECGPLGHPHFIGRRKPHNGDIDMADIMRLYKKLNINVPTLMAGEKQETAGYTALRRLYALGYLRGILEAEGCLN